MVAALPNSRLRRHRTRPRLPHVLPPQPHDRRPRRSAQAAPARPPTVGLVETRVGQELRAPTIADRAGMRVGRERLAVVTMRTIEGPAVRTLTKLVPARITVDQAERMRTKADQREPTIADLRTRTKAAPRVRTRAARTLITAVVRMQEIAREQATRVSLQGARQLP